MSFAFGFGGDDIDGDAHDGVSQQQNDRAQPLQSERPSLLPVQKFTFPQTLESLPSQISYNTLDLAEHVSIYRRSLFDIRAQLMAEADIGNDNDHLLAGLDQGDLTSGVYEGGFKTWECAIDLAQYIVSQWQQQHFGPGGNWHIVELGAGSAIPSCTLLRQATSTANRQQHRRFHFTLCDYNQHVLKLCTAPNVLLNTTVIPSDSENEQDLDLENFDAARLVDDLESKAGVTVDFVAGAWGAELAELVLASSGPASNLLVLASETIYAPGSLHAFVETLQTFLKSASVSVLVAAKQVYFGVGGGVEEFARVAEQEGLAVDLLSQVSSAGGVGRVILNVRRRRDASV